LIAESFQKQLQEILGPQGLLTAPGDLSPFSRDASRICSPPRIVLFPQTTSQTVEIVRLAHLSRIPVAIRGTGSGLDGGAVATRGGLLLSLEKMNRITEISPENMMAVVQPGVITARINARLKPAGLFYPIDPASQDRCTIGGDVSTAAHGLRGTKYGLIGNYLLGLEAVVPPGETIRCGAKTLKCATGYRLTGLLAGSRGRIGVITEIILKLLPRPQVQASLMAIFDTLAQAQQAKRALRQKRIWASRLELMDGPALEKSHLADFHADLSHDQMLMLAELDGPEDVVKKDVKTTLEILKKSGGKGARPAEGDREAGEWWRARGTLLSSLAGEKDLAVLLTIIVPGSRTVHFFEKVAEAAAEKSIFHSIYGHLGEGRWHSVFLVETGSATRERALLKLTESVRKTAASMGGRCQRPYAIGFTPGRPLRPPADPGQARLWRALKARFDPQGIFNPLE
jgi:glycolate oxidase